MELKDFITTKKTQKFIHTSYSTEYSKEQLLGELQSIIEKWIACGESDKETKHRMESELSLYEPITKEFNDKVSKLMSKWGLK